MPLLVGESYREFVGNAVIDMDRTTHALLENEAPPVDR
jgi:hypothetical protein